MENRENYNAVISQLKKRYYNLHVVINVCLKQNKKISQFLLDDTYDVQKFRGPIDVYIFGFGCLK